MKIKILLQFDSRIDGGIATVESITAQPFKFKTDNVSPGDYLCEGLQSNQKIEFVDVYYYADVYDTEVNAVDEFTRDSLRDLAEWLIQFKNHDGIEFYTSQEPKNIIFATEMLAEMKLEAPWDLEDVNYCPIAPMLTPVMVQNHTEH